MESSFNTFYLRWGKIHSWINLAGVVLIYFHLQNFWLIAVAISFSLFVFRLSKTTHHKSLPFGYANTLTLIRLVILLCVGYSFYILDSVWLISFCMLALLLDGLDGFLARMMNETSDNGEIFDIAVDAFSTLLFSTFVFLSNPNYFWIVVIGSFSFIYHLLIPKSFSKKQHNKISKGVRSSISVLFLCAMLIFCVWTSWVSEVLLVLSAFLISISFAISLFSHIKPSSR